MKDLDLKQAKKWCLSNGVTIVNDQPKFPNKHVFPISPNVTDRITEALSDIDKLKRQKHLVWVGGEGIFPSSEDSIDFFTFRREFGIDSQLIAAPAVVFQGDELEILSDYVLAALKSTWDIWIVASKMKNWLHYSHDEVSSSSFRR